MSPILPINNVNNQEEDENLISVEDVIIVRYSGLRQQLLRLQDLFVPLVYFGYSLILLCHFSGWILFSIYAIYCFFTQHSTTQRCKDFEYFSHPKELEVFWQTITGVNAIIYIILIRKLHFADGRSFSLKKLLKIPAATGPLLLKLFIAVSYETVMVFHEENQSAKAIEIGFIWRNVCVTSLVFFLNFTFPPRRLKYKMQYFCTLMVFFLDQFVMASLMVGHVHYRITALNTKPTLLENQDQDTLKGVISMMTIIGVFTLHTTLLKFFWCKLFDRAKNLLQEGCV